MRIPVQVGSCIRGGAVAEAAVTSTGSGEGGGWEDGGEQGRANDQVLKESVCGGGGGKGA